MIQDKISLLLQDLAKSRQKLRDVKKEIKEEEKIENEEYLELKKTLNDLKKQVKDLEEEELTELRKGDHFKKLVELKIKTEEEISNAQEQLFDEIAKMPQKPFEMNLEIAEGTVRVQIMPEMKLFLNGREEKKK